MNLTHYASKQFKKGQKPQPIPHKKWTVVDGYNHLNANVGQCALPGKPEISALGYGVYGVEVALRITGAKKGRQMLVRFVRNHETNPDDFGTDEKTFTSGRDWKTHFYFVYLKPGDRVCCEIWHDSGKKYVPLSKSAVSLEFAQFKMTLITPHDR